MKLLKNLFSFLFVLSILLTSCSDDDNNGDPIQPKPDEKEETTETLKDFTMAVASDVHYFDLSLLKKEGTAFQKYLDNDRKLLVESGDIIDRLVEELLADKPDILLIPGDLTKDGERIGHENLIKKLDKLRNAGIKTFVIPGNHDINNPDALSFDGDKTEAVAHVTPAEFAELYKNYGYDPATIVERGPDLCYLAEPIPGLWIIGIDACDYKENITNNTPAVGGFLEKEKLDWITSKAREGKEKNKRVISMMHHGALEHFSMQATLMSEYVVKDYADVSKSFAESGLNFVFTGHFHAQDIAKQTFGNSYLFDIETGSTVTYPTPYRRIKFDSEKMAIKTHHVNLQNEKTQNMPLVDYAYLQLEKGTPSFSAYLINEAVNRGYLDKSMSGLIKIMIKSYYPLLTEVYTNHLKGDEKGLSKENQELLDNLKKTVGTFKPDFAPYLDAIDPILIDSQPVDNDLTIYFNDGRTE